MFCAYDHVIAIILQPMDVIKTKQQGYFHQASLSKDMNTNMIKNIKWQNSTKMVFKERGIIGFWDGLVIFDIQHSFIVSEFGSCHIWSWIILLSVAFDSSG